MVEDSQNNGLLQWLPTRLRARIEQHRELQQALANIGWLSLQPVVDLAVGLLVGIWVARTLGPTDYGKLNFAIAFVALFSPLATVGVGMTVVRDLVREPDASADILGSATFVRAVGSVSLIIASFVAIVVIRPSDRTAWLFVGILAVGYGIRNIGTFNIWFAAKIQGKYTTWSQSISVLLGAVIRGTMIVAGAGVTLFVLAHSVRVALVSAAMFIFYTATSGIPLTHWRVRSAWVRRILSDSWPLVLGGFVAIISMKVDQVMLGEMRGETDVGIYAVAARLSEMFHFLPSFVGTSVFPSLLKARKIDRALYLNRFQLLYDVLFWFAVVSGLVMQLLATPIIGLLFGEQYISAGPVLALHIWSGIFWFSGLAGHRYLVAENHMRIQLFMTACGALSNVAMNLWLIPRFGPIGAACATLGSFAVSHWLSAIVFAPSRVTVLFFLRAFYLPGVIRRWAPILGVTS